jgi:hypothetical protein
VISSEVGCSLGFGTLRSRTRLGLYLAVALEANMGGYMSRPLTLGLPLGGGGWGARGCAPLALGWRPFIALDNAEMVLFISVSSALS